MTIHIYTAEKHRVRKMCPHHKHLCYGDKQEYYDTTRISFDCGTFADYGYGYYEPPKLYKSITIFNDDIGYTAWVPRSNWTMLARNVSLSTARKISKLRLKPGGIIKEHINHASLQERQ